VDADSVLEACREAFGSAPGIVPGWWRSHRDQM
jgi:hypothetical protein